MLVVVVVVVVAFLLACLLARFKGKGVKIYKNIFLAVFTTSQLFVAIQEGCDSFFFNFSNAHTCAAWCCFSPTKGLSFAKDKNRYLCSLVLLFTDEGLVLCKGQKQSFAKKMSHGSLFGRNCNQGPPRLHMWTAVSSDKQQCAPGHGNTFHSSI